MTTIFTYDPAGRLAELAHTAAIGEIDRVTYTHDAIGNRLSRTTLPVNMTLLTILKTLPDFRKNFISGNGRHTS